MTGSRGSTPYPDLSSVYLTEVDTVLERTVTLERQWTRVEYPRLDEAGSSAELAEGVADLVHLSSTSIEQPFQYLERDQ